MLEALTCSRREDGLSFRHGVKPPTALRVGVFCILCLSVFIISVTFYHIVSAGNTQRERVHNGVIVPAQKQLLGVNDLLLLVFHDGDECVKVGGIY